MQTTASSVTAAEAGAVCCLRCTGRVTIKGDPEWGPAFHSDTGKEVGRDGHMVAPVENDFMIAFETARNAGGCS